LPEFLFDRRLLPVLCAAAVVIGAAAIGARVISAPAAPEKRAALSPMQTARPALKPKPKPLSEFQAEQAMSPSQLMHRWDAFIAGASRRFHVPQSWIRAVMEIESGGRTMQAEGQKITSSQGAMGLMQLMPETYAEYRDIYRLGADPYDPHDNIFAGAAYLRFLQAKYGYPTLFAAYNDGPGNLEARLKGAGLLPVETTNYVADITRTLGGAHGGRADFARFTRPNGETVLIDCAAVNAVRAPFPGEFAQGVNTVITTGRKNQGVTETLARARRIVRAHGGVG